MAPKGFSITKNFGWLTKAFGRSLTPQSTAELPDLVLPTISPTVDALGWERLADYDVIEIVGVADQTQILLPINNVEGEVQWFFMLGLRSEDSVTRNFTMFYDARRGAAKTIPPGPVSIPLMQQTAVETFSWFALPRVPIPVFTGDQLQVDAELLTIGALFRVRGLFVRIPEGEYIPYPY